MSDSEYRVLQIFLSRETGGVSEVSFREEQPPHFQCTCPDAIPGKAPECVHAAIVEARLRSLGGKYPFPRIDPQKLAEAFDQDVATFRRFVMEHGVVELI